MLSPIMVSLSHCIPTPCRLCECMVVCLVLTKMRMGSGYLSGRPSQLPALQCHYVQSILHKSCHFSLCSPPVLLHPAYVPSLPHVLPPHINYYNIITLLYFVYIVSLSLCPRPLGKQKWCWSGVRGASKARSDMPGRQMVSVVGSYPHRVSNKYARWDGRQACAALDKEKKVVFPSSTA